MKKATNETIQIPINLLTNAAIIIAKADQHLTIIDCNQITEDFLGYKKKDIVGNKLSRFFSESENIEDTSKKVLSQKANPINICFLNKNGTELCSKVIVNPLVSSSKKPGHIFINIENSSDLNILKNKLNKTKKTLEIVLGYNRIGTWEYNIKTKEVKIDDNYASILGYTPGELNRKHDYSVYHPDDQDNVRKRLTDYIEGRSTKYESQQRIINDKKETIWILSQGEITEYDDEGKPLIMMGTAQDITDKKTTENEIEQYREHLEDNVKQRTKELEKKTKSIEESRKALTFLLEDVNEARLELKYVNDQLENVNKELEAFAYSISHDLRAPLRHIDGFINLLNKPSNQADAEKVQKYSEIISNSAKKMGRLIDDLLTFSRIGRNEIKKQDFNLNELLQEIIDEYRVQIEDRKIKFQIEELPQINADRSLMKVVFYNLIDNAIKFTRNVRNTKIDIGQGESQNGSIVLFVKDNGAGFNMKYVHKLFGVFQRLHTENEFEGTGIGLASVQRIIHKHGGKIWAEAETNKGATFFIKI